MTFPIGFLYTFSLIQTYVYCVSYIFDSVWNMRYESPVHLVPRSYNSPTHNPYDLRCSCSITTTPNNMPLPYTTWSRDHQDNTRTRRAINQHLLPIWQVPLAVVPSRCQINFRPTQNLKTHISHIFIFASVDKIISLRVDRSTGLFLITLSFEVVHNWWKYLCGWIWYKNDPMANYKPDRSYRATKTGNIISHP